MCFVLRNGGVRNCSSPFIDSETEAQSGNKQHRFIHSAIHSLTHLFIHSFILKCFWEPPKPRLSLKPPCQRAERGPSPFSGRSQSGNVKDTTASPYNAFRQGVMVGRGKRGAQVLLGVSEMVSQRGKSRTGL